MIDRWKERYLVRFKGGGGGRRGTGVYSFMNEGYVQQVWSVFRRGSPIMGVQGFGADSVLL